MSIFKWFLALEEGFGDKNHNLKMYIILKYHYNLNIILLMISERFQIARSEVHLEGFRTSLKKL